MTDFGGGPYDAPEPQDWEPDRDGCPACGGCLGAYRHEYECLDCGKLFDLDGIEKERVTQEDVCQHKNL